jgi:cytochrome c oxidase subunit III
MNEAEATEPVAEHFGTRENQNEGTEFGMWVFLATEVLFFGGLLLGYAYGRHRYPAAWAQASAHTDLVIGTINTFLLITSALMMSLAIRAAQLLRHRQVLLFLILAVALGVMFEGLKGLEYHDDLDMGLAPWFTFAFHGADRAAIGLFFYIYFGLTALHALHLGIAITIASIYIVRIWNRPVKPFRQQIVVMGLYWHFVDGMWVLLYTLIYVAGPRS